MHIRWDDNYGSGATERRFLGVPPVAWALAVPVAFIVGAAVMNFVDISRKPAMDSSSVITEAAAVANDLAAEVSAQRDRLQVQLNDAEDSIASLRIQLQTLREQLSGETQRRIDAERTAEEAKSAPQDLAAPTAPIVQASVSATADTAPEPDSSLFVDHASAGTPAVADSNGSQADQSASLQADDAQTEDKPSISPTLQRFIEDAISQPAAADRPKAGAVTTEVSANAGASGKSQRTARNADAVAVAMEKATGLDAASASEREVLKRQLIAGACVSTSLEDLFGNPVPVVPLRNLIRDLDSDC